MSIGTVVQLEKLVKDIRDAFGLADPSGMNHLEALRSALGEGEVNVGHALAEIAEALTRIADALAPRQES
jgi:hypothetical protein